MMKFDLRDVHVYGGMVLIAGGVLGLAGWEGALIALGIVSLYLGTYRMGRL
jgi:hypothetical protein|tara:strand:- start:738 stop:890 length:153 start_codon:yes stop_codon:yes gene_type:complete